MQISLHDVSKKYMRNDEHFYAVDHISLKVSGGEFVSVFGKSGSGKSTLLHLIAGIVKPTEGEILFDEKNIAAEKDDYVSKFRNKKIGYVAQGYSLLSNLTVVDNIRLAGSLYEPKTEKKKEIEKLLKRLEIEHLKNSYPEKLSGGEIRRVAIARALVNKPEVILADEPTGDLDEENTKIVLEMFQELAMQGTTIIMVTHDKETLDYATKIYEMKKGKLHLYEDRTEQKRGVGYEEKCG